MVLTAFTCIPLVCIEVAYLYKGSLIRWKYEWKMLFFCVYLLLKIIKYNIIWEGALTGACNLATRKHVMVDGTRMEALQLVELVWRVSASRIAAWVSVPVTSNKIYVATKKNSRNEF